MSQMHQSAAPCVAGPTGVSGADEERVLGEVLVARLARGDASAIGALFDTWCDPVHALVTRIVGDAHDVEAIVEGVFDQAWRSAQMYQRDRGTPHALLLAIARENAHSVMRGDSARYDGRAV